METFFVVETKSLTEPPLTWSLCDEQGLAKIAAQHKLPLNSVRQLASQLAVFGKTVFVLVKPDPIPEIVAEQLRKRAE